MTLDIAALRALHKAATPGEWDWRDVNNGFAPWVTRVISVPNEPYHELNVMKVRIAQFAKHECCWAPTDADAALIVASVNAMPGLLDAAEERDRLRDFADDNWISTLRAEEERDLAEAAIERVRGLVSEIEEAAAESPVPVQMLTAEQIVTLTRRALDGTL